MGEPNGRDWPTHVVTNFLLRRDRGRDELLLVQRSGRVRTYQGAWAGISGYVEPGVTPLQQAYTELSEEAGLSQQDLRLLRTGEPLAFRDESIRQSWVVHPFLFEIEQPERVRTDWEATNMQWVTPEQLRQLPTVPMLTEALERVYP
ncbi:MAG TPA: NUDIX domain-containing protein [Ktedonobacterales bacterium]|nr:NUDIX domain-containing protein [Ktedonobacterales bacterium]